MIKEQQLTKYNLDLDEQFVIPLQRDLHNCKRYKIPMIFKSPFAVFVKKMASTNRTNWINSWKEDKEVIQKDYQEFNKFDFLVNFQYKKNITFNSDEMEYFEKVQQISELKNICIPEKDPNQTLEEFENQLGGLISRNNRKIIIPVLEPSTNQLEEKTFLIKQKGLQRCAVIFRGYEKSQDRRELSEILATLRTMNIFSFVFGVSPAKWKKTQASMLYPLIYFKANGVSPWIAWRGWATNLPLLCSDWIFKGVKIADKGLSNYDGKIRKEFLDKKKSINFNTALSQIDTINQSTEISRTLKPLTKIQFEKLFS